MRLLVGFPVRLVRVLRHLRAHLVYGQKSYSMLLEDYERLRKVCGCIAHGIKVSRHLRLPVRLPRCHARPVLLLAEWLFTF